MSNFHALWGKLNPMKNKLGLPSRRLEAVGVRRNARVSPSHAPVLFCAHYFQALKFWASYLRFFSSAFVWFLGTFLEIATCGCGLGIKLKYKYGPCCVICNLGVVRMDVVDLLTFQNTFLPLRISSPFQLLFILGCLAISLSWENP